MLCAKCGYSLSSFDPTCPRCNHLPGTSVPTPSTVQMIPQSVAIVVNTGLGTCPQCRSQDLIQFDNWANHNRAWTYILSGCALGLAGIPLILFFGFGFLMIIAGIVLFVIGMFSGTHRKISTSRQCNACNYRWLV